MEEQTAAAEWLPPGWTVEIRVRKSGKKDWCYTDPSKEHKFKSKPEVLRYLKSINNIPESDGKRRSSRNHPSLDSPAVVKRVNPANSGTNGQKTNNQRLGRRSILQDEKIVKPFAGVEEISILSQKEENKSANGDCDLVIEPEAPRNIPEVGKSGNNNKKSKNTDKKAGLPCRASKRLAGVDVGPVPELSPNNRTRRVSARRVNDSGVGTTKSLLDNNTKAIGNEDNKHDCLSEGSSFSKEQDLTRESGNNNKSGDVACVSIEVPMQDLWNDPCIEFAIKTLTGQIPIEEGLIKYKVPTEVPKPSTESAFCDLWADPCIEFAVKTLTGDIPINDLSFQNYFQSRNQGL